MKQKRIMELPWVADEDIFTPFAADNIGFSGDDDGDEVSARLNAAADYLVDKYNIGIPEARNRLWNRGDCYPRLLIAESEMKKS